MPFVPGPGRLDEDATVGRLTERARLSSLTDPPPDPLPDPADDPFVYSWVEQSPSPGVSGGFRKAVDASDLCGAGAGRRPE